MRHNLLKQLSLLALLLLGEVLTVRAQPASPCPATGISTDPGQSTNPLRPDRRNTFFNWFAPGGTGPNANLFYSAYSLDPRTGRGVAYDQYSPYQQPDNARLTALLGAGDLPANGWELLAYNLGYTDKGQPRPGGADLLYVVLYHRFTGIMRVFATEANPIRSYTTHFITLRFASGTGLAFKSGLLNRVAAPATALLDAPAGVAAVLHGVGSHLNYGGKWFFADFPLDYDPCTCLFRSELEVAMGGLDPRIPSSGLVMPGLPSITVAGPVSGIVSSPYGDDEVNLSGIPVLGYAGQVPGAFLTTGYSSTSVASQQRNSRGWLQARTHDAALAVALDSAAWYWFKARDAAASTGSHRFLSPDFLQNPRTERLTNGLDFLTLGGFSANLPGPGVTSVSPPSAFAQTGSRLRGYSAPTHSMGIIRLATPGAVAAPDSSRYPYYNEVLGVLSLLRRPVVERSVEPIRDAAGQPRLRYRFRLPADLEYALNPAAGLEVTDFRAALVVGGSAYPSTPAPGDFGTYEAPVPLTDDPAGPVQHLLRTSYVGASCLSGRVFTLDGPAGCGAGFLPDSAVSVKIWVQLRRPGVPAAQLVLLVARYPAKLVEVSALGPAPAAGPCTGLLAPQPSHVVAALCLSPAYAEAMRLGRPSTAASTTTPAAAAAVVLNVFPNPTTEPVSVRLTLPEPQCVRLRLYDGLGRLVAVPLAPTPYPAGTTTFVLSNMPRLAAGLYFLMLDADNRRLVTTQLVVAAE
ncbi:T9SS type A sorting domain-containing protein [Hymenobacter sp. UYCo722]|uniref:T9SS type A sorting domain-containing protein n=1 Tax=Hymenobacter sp. UYCo722 TaxID=3156335 RepID=UPI00339A3097